MPLTRNRDKLIAWQRRSREKAALNASIRKADRPQLAKLNRSSSQRRSQEAEYAIKRRAFLLNHPVCPVTGQPATQIHHCAKREGRWLLIIRYWVGVSLIGHAWIENNKADAERLGLMVRIRDHSDAHLQDLKQQDIDPNIPAFYLTWNGIPLVCNL